MIVTFALSEGRMREVYFRFVMKDCGVHCVIDTMAIAL